MKYYFVDFFINKVIEEWLFLQGAVVARANNMPTYDYKTGKGVDDIEIFFGHRKLHYFAENGLVRIFFNDTNISTALILLLKWPDSIVRHSLPKEYRERIT